MNSIYAIVKKKKYSRDLQFIFGFQRPLSHPNKTRILIYYFCYSLGKAPVRKL